MTMNLPLDDHLHHDVQHSPFQFPSAKVLSQASNPFEQKLHLDTVQPSARKNARHKRNVSIAMAPSHMDYPSFFSGPREYPLCTYSALSCYLNQPDQHIVFEQGGYKPHVVISLPEPDLWVSVVHWLMAVEVVEPDYLAPPPVYQGPDFLPDQAPERYMDARPPLSPKGYSQDPGASLLLAAKKLRGTHIDDSPDPSRSPHIIIQEAPPLDPEDQDYNTVDDQDLQYGRQLAVPHKPAFNEPEDECEEYFQYYEGEFDEGPTLIEIPAPEMTPEEFYSMRAVECERSIYQGQDSEDSETDSRTTSRSDSPQTPPDDEEPGLSTFNHWPPFREAEDFTSDEEDEDDLLDGPSASETSAAMWKAGMEESLPDCYRLDEDDDELPSLDETW
ncbi:hypothetical protein DL96DRAFT_1592452 [Flagelloscypha sp. PMI_526]|nr:hypothetical protein DL96DRAFT_1592452 [Flagelloscypha sp. PMI_526]